MEGHSRKTANHYGVPYANSYACSNGAPSVYTTGTTGCTANGYGFSAQQQQLSQHHQQQLHEDYRPIYFYVAQPYTIPYTFAKRPKPAASSLLRTVAKPLPARSNYRVKFSRRLGNADFSQKVKQGEFSRSLNQVHFAESHGQGCCCRYFVVIMNALLSFSLTRRRKDESSCASPERTPWRFHVSGDWTPVEAG